MKDTKTAEKEATMMSPRAFIAIVVFSVLFGLLFVPWENFFKDGREVIPSQADIDRIDPAIVALGRYDWATMRFTDGSKDITFCTKDLRADLDAAFASGRKSGDVVHLHGVGRQVDIHPQAIALLEYKMPTFPKGLSPDESRKTIRESLLSLKPVSVQ